MKKRMVIFIASILLIAICRPILADTIYTSPELKRGINEYGNSVSSLYDTASNRDLFTTICATVIILESPTYCSDTIINTVVNALVSDSTYLAKVNSSTLGAFFFHNNYLVCCGYLPATDTLIYTLMDNSTPVTSVLSSLKSSGTILSYNKVNGPTCVEAILAAITD